jgi:flavin-dependent dehydrogenase
MLVGDAAGLVSPITGEGIFYGVASGLLAADTAVETVKTRSPRLILTYEQKIGELLRPELNVLRFVAEKLYGSKRTLQTVCDVAAVDPVVRDLIIDLVIGAKPAQSVKSRLLKQMLIHHPLQTIKIGLG